MGAVQRRFCQNVIENGALKQEFTSGEEWDDTFKNQSFSCFSPPQKQRAPVGRFVKQKKIGHVNKLAVFFLALSAPELGGGCSKLWAAAFVARTNLQSFLLVSSSKTLCFGSQR